MGKRLGAIAALILIVLVAFYWTASRRSKQFSNQPIGQAGTSDKAPGSTNQASKVSGGAIPVTNAIRVNAGLVSQEVMNDRLTAIGTGKALNTVSLTPWSNGTIEKIYVAAGAHVKPGDAIVKLDSDKEQIAFEKADFQLNDANLALARIEKLRATNTATEVQEINARLAVENAKLELRDAKLALDRRTIRSPIDGVVGILPVDSGNYVTTDKTIARIDDRSKVLVDVWIPERFAPLVHIGDKVEAQSIARPGEVYQGTINAIDNMIDENSRTLRIRAELNNEDDVLRAGMSFEVSLRFKGDVYPSVDPLAIQWQSTGSFVWKIVGDQVERVAVRIVERTPDRVLVVGQLNLNDLVVVQGLQNLRLKSRVIVANRQNLRDELAELHP